MTYFHFNLSYLRGKRGFSISDFAEATKISSDVITKLEANKIEPSLAQLVSISKVLNYGLDRLIKENIGLKELRIKDFEFGLLALDVDGVLTDAGMYYSQTGDEFKKFNAKDGMAIKELAASGRKVAFISSGINSNIINNRAKHLGVELVYVGKGRKLEVMEQWCSELNITLKQVAYIGDDINDAGIIVKSGLSACPSDSVDVIKEIVDVVLTKKGGEGCIREFVDDYLLRK